MNQQGTDEKTKNKKQKGEKNCPRQHAAYPMGSWRGVAATGGRYRGEHRQISRTVLDISSLGLDEAGPEELHLARGRDEVLFVHGGAGLLGGKCATRFRLGKARIT